MFNLNLLYINVWKREDQLVSVSNFSLVFDTN